MEIELRRVMELAVHVKLASEAVLGAARSLAEIEPDGSGTDAWRRTMDELIAMNVELSFMERILRRAAVDGAAVLPASVRGRRSATS
jgi:hypothetical protein